MKLVLTVLAMMMTANMSNAHPLDGAIRGLVKTQLELDDVKSRNPADPDIIGAADRLKQNVGAIWLDAILIPVRAADAKLVKFGYYLEEHNSVDQYFQVRKNQNAEQLDQEASDMKPERWIELGKVADEQAIDISQIGSMLTNPDYSNGISDSMKNTAQSGASRNRLDALLSIKKRAATTVACIGYFSTAFNNYGLVPVTGQSGQLTWSTTALLRVHGARDMGSLSATERVSVRSELSELRDKVIDYDSVCVDLAQGAFIENELNKIDGK